jgi:hypothetical protein
MDKKNNIVVKILTISLAIFLALGSVAYIVARIIGNQKYEEKWQDYDDCGCC